jgi:hypothetical protein
MIASAIDHDDMKEESKVNKRNKWRKERKEPNKRKKVR